MNGDWVTWALQLLIVLGITRLWVSTDKNTDAVTQLRVDLPTNYETKDDHTRDVDRMDREREDSRKRVNGLGDQVHAMQISAAAAAAAAAARVK